MKFVLSEQEKKEFQEKILYDRKAVNKKEIDDRHWELFWIWFHSGDFSVGSNMEELLNNYFTDLFDSKPLEISHEDFLKELADLYSEHRIDVSEIIGVHLDGRLPKNWKTQREHRFITFMIPKSLTKLDIELECQYDTLTGHLEVFKCTEDPDTKEEWICLDGVKYAD